MAPDSRLHYLPSLEKEGMLDLACEAGKSNGGGYTSWLTPCTPATSQPFGNSHVFGAISLFKAMMSEKLNYQIHVSLHTYGSCGSM